MRSSPEKHSRHTFDPHSCEYLNVIQFVAAHPFLSKLSLDKVFKEYEKTGNDSSTFATEIRV